MRAGWGQVFRIQFCRPRTCSGYHHHKNACHQIAMRCAECHTDDGCVSVWLSSEERVLCLRCVSRIQPRLLASCANGVCDGSVVQTLRLPVMKLPCGSFALSLMPLGCSHPDSYATTGEFVERVVNCAGCANDHSLVLSVYKCRVCSTVSEPSEFHTLITYLNGPDPGPHWLRQQHLREGTQHTFSLFGIPVTYKLEKIEGTLFGRYARPSSSAITDRVDAARASRTSLN
jgi:hypothetical protein